MKTVHYFTISLSSSSIRIQEKEDKSKQIKASIIRIINDYTRTRQMMGDLSSKFAGQARTGSTRSNPNPKWVIKALQKGVKASHTNPFYAGKATS